MTRDELIYKRFRLNAEWVGDADIKRHRGTVRRTVGSLRTALDTFEQYLSSEQIDAIKQARQALDVLGDDLERAEKIARKVKLEADARREQATKERQTKLILTQLGVASLDAATTEEVLTLAEDISEFAGKAARAWWVKATGRPESSFDFYLDYRLDELAKVVRTSTEPDRRAKIQRLIASIGQHLDKLNDAWRNSPKIEDFRKFRVFQGDRRKIAAMARPSSE
ncbi:hypothetical protein [Burkholderia cepacia]|uniref:CHAD domain-containing protein n=1 Tax=Burkholderia cepacia TaxID=292 RepID=A0AAX2RAM8_BURCE|nr:hypothetical protein [Burkholderia cepacia]TES96177.1 hypothetical protein E3D36_36640 [Burkholderia cepacia]TEU32953.1 hypothetical protein E3D37_42045 [Burkholderia cepacia]TEU36205.1 hypothetical protein E3D38_41180 [Burkholderia cepacia]TEU85098.1 hypothetical protein E3D40_42305 [Burkholderia cepacia]TEU95283.1 hypothetical protein E3D44_42965 [Burkholderia cepacia]